MKMEDDLNLIEEKNYKNLSKKWKTSSKKKLIEDDLKKTKWETTSKKNGRRPQKEINW
jgi:hypothetical protein